MSPPYKTDEGKVDRMICGNMGPDATVTVWMVGTVHYAWFTNLDGEVRDRALLALRLLDIGAQTVGDKILEQFTHKKKNGKLLSTTVEGILT